MRQVIYFDKNDKNYNSRALSTVGDFTNSSVHVIDNWAEDGYIWIPYNYAEENFGDMWAFDILLKSKP